MTNTPTRNDDNTFYFEDYPNFKPNLSPKEILHMGSFGGGYFRPIYSSVTDHDYGDEVWQELPQDWLEKLDIENKVFSKKYQTKVNYYKVKCGSSLSDWEEKGWITEHDPYGWFQWYCRFFQGRRCEDDERQVRRGMNCMGENGRWRLTLCKKIVDKVTEDKTLEEAFNDHKISPGIRQTLQHWGYKLTLEDLKEYVDRR